MSAFIAALPMYDWPERRAEVDAEWVEIRAGLLAQGIEAPLHLTRRNADMPPAPGGIRDADGRVIAPDPARLPPDELDFHTLWRHPALVFAQTCWGPLETTDLARHVRVIGQPDYSAFEGGQGALYRSALVMRRGVAASPVPPEAGQAILPGQMSGMRLAYNEPHSMSGYLALARDLAAQGEIAAVSDFPDFWAAMLMTGSHRASIRAVAEGRADVAAIDCRTWAIARQYEPAAPVLEAVGWTSLRKGLPFIQAKGLFA